MRAGLVARALLVALCLGACAAPPSPVTELRRHQALEVARDETWMARELRRFRTYRHLDRAYRLTTAGDLEGAAKEFQRYLAIDPVDPQVRFDYLVVLHRLHRHAEVIPQADAVLRGHPDFAPAVFYRALAHQALGNDEAAWRDFVTVADRSEGEPEQQVFALTMAVDLALARRALGPALDGADRLVRLRPVFAHHLRRGRILEMLGRGTDADAAFQAALRAAQRPEDLVLARDARAALAEKRRDWDLARRELLAMLQAEPGPAVAVRERLANVLYASKDYRGGVHELRRLVTHVSGEDDRHRILMALAYGYTKLGKGPDAVESFREAAKLKPDPSTLEALGEALIRARRWDEAATALGPIADRDHTGRTHLKIATLYTRTRRWQDALNHLAASAAADQAGPIRTEVYRQQGYIYYSLERYADARRAFEQSLRQSSGDARVYVALGETCMRLNAYADAITYLKKALALTDGTSPR